MMMNDMTEIGKNAELTENNAELSKGFTVIEPSSVMSSNDITELVRSEFFGGGEGDMPGSFSEDLLDVLDSFKSENWDRMSDTEKVDAVAELVEVLGKELKLPEIPHLFLVDREESYCGSYVPGVNTIVINRNGFSDPKELVDTVAHELRHAYQEYRAEVLETREDAMFRDNFENYVSPEYDLQGNCINFDAYEAQYVEVDARAFAGRITDAMKS